MRAIIRRPATVAFTCGLMAALVAGCGRPTGDFDRARPSVVHDTLLPEAGRTLAVLRAEPTSLFNLTDDERLLRDRAWGLVRPPHSEDWVDATAVEAQRTRLIPPIDDKLDPRIYYMYLRSDRYRSSEVRYDRVIADMSADTDLVLPFCEVASRVEDLDEERLRAISRRPDLTEEEYAAGVGRVNENKAVIAWAKRALRFRLAAYRYAIDRLEIETPSRDRVWEANTAWRRFGARITYAEQGCREQQRYANQESARRSRIYTNWGGERPTPQK